MPRPSPRTNRTRRVPHPVLIGHAASLSQVYLEEGAAGLFRGMETKLWHSTLISALMFLTYGPPPRRPPARPRPSRPPAPG